MVSELDKIELGLAPSKSLNPCSGGLWFLSAAGIAALALTVILVLILVLVDYGF